MYNFIVIKGIQTTGRRSDGRNAVDVTRTSGSRQRGGWRETVEGCGVREGQRVRRTVRGIGMIDDGSGGGDARQLSARDRLSLRLSGGDYSLLLLLPRRILLLALNLRARRLSQLLLLLLLLLALLILQSLQLLNALSLLVAQRLRQWTRSSLDYLHVGIGSDGGNRRGDRRGCGSGRQSDGSKRGRSERQNRSRDRGHRRFPADDRVEAVYRIRGILDDAARAVGLDQTVATLDEVAVAGLVLSLGVACNRVLHVVREAVLRRRVELLQLREGCRRRQRHRGNHRPPGECRQSQEHEELKVHRSDRFIKLSFRLQI